MFSVKDIEAVDIDSTWKSEIPLKDAGLQTSEFATTEKKTSTHETSTIETQTETKNDAPTEVDMSKLAAWLNKIYPSVTRELNDNTLSNAMASTNYGTETSTATSNRLQIINITKAENEVCFVSCMCWNNSGNTLAVACRYKHESWCHHRGEIKLYTFDRDGMLPETPYKNLVCNACVTSMSFHLSNTSILAVGTISGELSIWHVYGDESENLLTSVTEHEDKVTVVSWIMVMMDTKQTIQLATASLDALFILWNFVFHEKKLQIHQRYKINKSPFPKGGIVKNLDIISKKIDSGILHFDFSVSYPGVFVVATEGGYIAKCSLMGAQPIPGEKQILDPFELLYESHHGELNALQFSPHRKDLFFTSGTDDEIRIYHIQQVTPVQIIFVANPVSDVSWIAQEEHLIVASGLDGFIKIYSLRDGQHIPNTVPKEKNPLVKIAVNSKRHDLAVAGNDKGDIELWNVPWNDISALDKHKVLTKKK